MDRSKPSLKTLFWNTLETEEAARLARIPAFIFSVLGAIIWSIIAIMGLFRPNIYGNWSILYAALYIFVSLSLFRMRREAAITGFILSLVGLFFQTDSIKLISDALMLLTNAFAIRGTYSYVRLRKNLKNINSV